MGKLSDEQVRAIIGEYICGATMPELGEKYGVSWVAIRNRLMKNKVQIRKSWDSRAMKRQRPRQK